MSLGNENVSYHKVEEEKTEVIYGIEEVMTKAVEFLLDAKERFDNCLDSAGPSALVSTDVVWEGVLALKNRGVKIRVITEVIRENMPYCKRIMESA